ncbi:MAG: nitroreductase [Chloroflexi bacterium]|nr:nitroreductase [Chloroflexota bacterium]
MGEIAGFYETVRQRHSMRRFAPRPVEDEKLLRILEAARLAPSWRNGQCWRFLVVREPELIARLAKEQPLGYQINRWLSQAPLVLVACGDPAESGRREDQDFYLVDVAIAMEHAVLAATAEGLGTCWIGAMNEERVRQILEIPANIRVVALTPMGYPAEGSDWYGRAVKALAGSLQRKSLSEIVHWDRWQE